MIPPRQHSRLGPHGQHGTVKGSGFFFFPKKRKETWVPVRASSVGATHEQKDLLDEKEQKREREREVFCKPEGDGPHGQHGTVKGSAFF